MPASASPGAADPPSERYAALLRGVNVGAANRVSMADLRAVVASRGYRAPRTLLASGNVVFLGPAADPAEVAGRLQEALARDLGLAVPVAVLTVADVGRAVEQNPFGGTVADPSRLQVGFLAHGADPRPLERLAAQDWSPEALRLAGEFVYAWCPNGVARSALMTAVGKATGESLTMRNWSTVLKLQQALAALA